MEIRKIHALGPEFSRIIAGAWRWHNVPVKTIDTLMHTALDQGITTFDHADIYGDHSNEEYFGSILKKEPSLRNKMQLVSKCGIMLPSARRPHTRIKHYNTSAEHILWSVENSLKMLGTDRLDLLLIHRPDPLLDPAEVEKSFTRLRKDGKVLHFGVSNFSPSQFRMLQSHLNFPLVTNQLEISLGRVEPLFNGDLDVLMELGAAPMAWSPLAGGKPMLADKDWQSLMTRYQVSYSQLSLAWLLRHPSTIFPVIGTTQPDRIVECSKSIAIKLEDQDWFQMLKWARGHDIA